MKLLSYAKVYVTFTIIILFLYLYWTKYFFLSSEKETTTVQNANSKIEDTSKLTLNARNKVVVAVVACGIRLQETLNMIKSAIMFTETNPEFIVVAEDQLMQGFQEKLEEWQKLTKNSFTFRVMPLTFPPENAEEWQKLFKPCASQRLFLPSVLSDVDSILYVDTDILFMTPVEKIWEHFYKMNSSQMAALAPEHEDPNVGWYNRFARHPYYGKLGVNSGVMLMNLTRMREFQWDSYVGPIYKKYKLKITWGDQDIINIIFHYHPDKLYIYSCRYNFRPDHCMYMSVCKSAEKHGVAVLHGSRGFFHNEKQPVFKTIYETFEKLGSNLDKDFYQVLESDLDATTQTNCGHLKDLFLKNVRHLITERNEKERKR